MATKTFKVLPDDQLARQFYAAVCALIDRGVFDDEQHAADRIGVSLTQMLSWADGFKVPPRIISVATKRFGISPAFLHLDIGPPVVDRNELYKIARIIS